MMDIPGLIKERQLDAMRSLGRKLGAERERHIEVHNQCSTFKAFLDTTMISPKNI